MGALSSGAIRVISLAINFFLTPFLLHRIGDVQYGLFILVGSVVTQGALLDLGIEVTIVKYVAEYHARGEHDRAGEMVVISLALYCVLGLVALLLAAAIAPIFPYLFNVPEVDRSTATMAVLLVGIRVAISIPLATPGAILWGLHKYTLCNAVSVIEVLMSAVTTIAVLLAGGGLIALLAASIPVTIVARIILIWCISQVAPDFRLRWPGARRDLIRTVLSFSASTFVLDLANNLTTRMDQIVIGVFLPISSVGFYSVAQRISVVPQMFSEPVLTAFLPIASQLHAQDDVYRLRSLYLVGSRVILAICVPLLVVVIILAGPLLSIWVGAKYAVNAPIVVVLALASILQVGYWPGRLILQGIGQHHGLAKASICLGIANVGLSLLLVRPFGLVGVALGTLIPAIVVNVGYIWPYTMRTVHASVLDLLKQALVPVLAPALPMIVATYVMSRMIKPSGLLAIGTTAATGAAVYAIIFIAVFSGDHERQLIRSLLSRLIKKKYFRSN